MNKNSRNSKIWNIRVHASEELSMVFFIKWTNMSWQIRITRFFLMKHDKNYVKKKERERHLPGC